MIVGTVPREDHVLSSRVLGHLCRQNKARVNAFKFRNWHWEGDLIQCTLKRTTTNPWTLIFLPVHPRKRSCQLLPKDIEWELHVGQKHHPRHACTCWGHCIFKKRMQWDKWTPHTPFVAVYTLSGPEVDVILGNRITRATLSAQQFLSELYMLQVFPLVTGSQSTDRWQEEIPVSLWLKAVCAEPLNKEESLSTEGSGEKYWHFWTLIY